MGVGRMQLTITRLIMDEETQLRPFQAPPTLNDLGRFAPDRAQEGQMREIEVSQALDVREERQGDEIQGREVREVPLHVWKNEEAERRVRLWRRAEEDFLGFGSTGDDLVYPMLLLLLFLNGNA